MKQHGLVDVGAVTYRLVSVDAEEMPAISGCDGCYDTEEQVLAVDAKFEPGGERFEEVSGHEALHSLLYESGASHMLGLTDKQEEDLVRILSPHHARMFKLRVRAGAGRKVQVAARRGMMAKR